MGGNPTKMVTSFHPEFRINDSGFTSQKALIAYCQDLVRKGREDEKSVGNFILEWISPEDNIEVTTSGSTGIPKAISLKKEFVRNSAKATIEQFDLKEGTRALLCLSSEYIAGKMMVVRALIGGWNLLLASPGKNPLSTFKNTIDFTAMVPYQVFHSLEHLHKVKTIIVGGGAVDSQFEKRLQDIPARMFATYGMTETISHIAIRKINGKDRTDIFSALPKVGFSIDSRGCLIIYAPLISSERVVTNDVVQLLSPTQFRFLGRIDNAINTGGVKVFPETVESVLSSYINTPFIIAGQKDEALGQRLILIVEAQEPQEFSLYSQIFEHLPPYSRPRAVFSLPEFVYTETGKIIRGEVLKKVIKGH